MTSINSKKAGIVGIVGVALVLLVGHSALHRPMVASGHTRASRRSVTEESL